MTNPVPTSDATYYVAGARHGERLTLVHGRNAYDGTPFDPRGIEVGDLMRAQYVRHRGDGRRGSLVTDDGRHIAVPHAFGRFVVAARIVGLTGTALAFGGIAAATLVVSGVGAALGLAAWVLGRACIPLVRGAVRDVEAAAS